MPPQIRYERAILVHFTVSSVLNRNTCHFVVDAVTEREEPTTVLPSGDVVTVVATMDDL